MGSINVALLVVDKDLVVEFANPAYYAAFGTSAAKTIGHRLFHDHEALLADDRLQALLTAVAEHGVTVDRYSANAQRADGNPSAVNIAAKRIRRQGISTDRTLILISDVTEEARERTQSFNEVERSHAQIVEINHRVKNNLGSVLAMLRMEHRLVRGTKAAGILERIALRVESIATLYELLAINSNTGSIQLLAYFRSLGGSIEKVAGAEDGGWTITVTGDDALLNVEEAINIGAVVNELVANAAKYAFRRMPVGGRISIDGGLSSQYVSALLMAAPLADAPVDIVLTGDQ
ncbi:MAG: histidine kinase dimerization/phosphoacceptor domain -containing protein, partial [Pseudomonadota bacterium]